MANKVINCILNLKDKFSFGIQNAAKNSKKLQRELKSLKNDVNNLKKSFSGISTAFKVGGAAITAGAISCVKEYASFEQAMRNLQATTGASNDDFKKLWDTAKNLGATTSYSCQQSAEAMNFLGMAGFKTNQIIGAMPSLLDLAAASGSDLAKVSDIVSDGLGAFHLMQGDIASNTKMFSDVLAKTASSANTTVDLMGESFKYCASICGALGYNVQDTAVVLGLMGNEFTKGGSAGNALKNAISKLANPIGEAQDVVDEYNLSLKKSDGSMKSLSDVVKMLRSKFGGLNKDVQAAKVSMLFGTDAMAPWLTVINSSEESFQNLTKAINESKDAAKEMAAIKLNTITGQFELLKSAISTMKIDIGEKLAPYTKNLVIWTTEQIPKISDKILYLVKIFTDNLPQIISFSKKLVVFWLMMKGITVSMKIGKIFTDIIKIGGKSFKILKDIIKGTQGIGAVFGLISNPVGVALSAIVLLAGGFALLNSEKIKLEDIKLKFENIGKTIRDFVKNNIPLLSVVGGALSAFFAFKLLNPFSAGINSLGNAFGKTLLKMISFKGVTSKTIQILKLIFNPIKILKGGFSLLGAKILSLKRAFLLFKTFAPSAIFGFISNFGKKVFNLKNILNIFKSGLGGLIKALMGLFSPFTLVVAGIALLVAGFIYCWNTNEEFRNKLTSAWQQIYPIVTTVIQGIVGFIIWFAKTLYDFYVTHQEQINTCIQSVLTIFGGAILIITDTITGIIDIIGGVIKVIDGLIHGDWSKVWEGCKEIFTGTIGTIKKWWNNLKEFFAKPIKAMINVFKKDSGTSSTEEVEKVDANATGTHFFGGGWTRMNERGGELAYLPGGSAIVPADKTDKMLNGNNININVNVQGNVIGNEQFADYVGNHIWNKIQLAQANM